MAENYTSGLAPMLQANAILVFGMRRSGTTWLAKIFDSHPETLYRHEPDSWIALPEVPYFPEIGKEPTSSPALDRFYDELRTCTLPHVVAKAPYFDKNYFGVAQEIKQLGLAFFSKSMKRVFGANVGCYNAIPHLGAKHFRLVWKSVESPGRLAYFTTATPGSRSVFLLRHPCGYVNSYLRGQAIGKMPRTSEDKFNVDIWSWRMDTTTAQSYGLSMDDVYRWTRKERMIWEWIIDNQFVLESIKDRDDVKVVVYDELCLAPEQTVREVFEHCRLDWNPQTAQFLTQGKRKKRDAYFSVYKDPAITADAWRRQLSRDDQKLVIKTVENTLPASYFTGSLTVA